MSRGLSRKGFDIDLREGEAQEDSLARLMLGHGPKVEVKTDAKATSTGNAFLEFEQAGPPSYVARPSGLAVTVAHWWATALVDANGEPWGYVLRKTDDMKALGRRAYREGRQKPGGDNDLYRGVLVPLSWLVEPAETMSVPVAATVQTACGAASPDGAERCVKEPGHDFGHRSDNQAWPKERAA